VAHPAGDARAAQLVERRRLRMPRAVRLDHLGVHARLAHLTLPPLRLFDLPARLFDLPIRLFDLVGLPTAGSSTVAATRSSSRMPVCAPEGKRSTVGSSRPGTPRT